MSGIPPENSPREALSGLRQRLPEIAVLLVVAALAIWDGLRIHARPRIGAAEAGGWLIGIAVLLALTTLLFAMRARKEPIGGGSLSPVIFAASVLILYAALMPVLGYMLATALFTAAYILRFGRYGMLRSLAGAILFAVATAYLWTVLEVMLPQGIVPWP